MREKSPNVIPVISPLAMDRIATMMVVSPLARRKSSLRRGEFTSNPTKEIPSTTQSTRSKCTQAKNNVSLDSERGS